MRKICTLILTFLFFAATSQTTIYSESFETDGEGVRYFTNTYYEASPNCNFFMRTTASPLEICFQNNLFNSFQGSFFWGSEDIMRSGFPLPPGFIQSQSINISGYNSLAFSLYLATANNVIPTNTRWETADSINIQISINGGPYRTVGRFMGNVSFGGDLIKDVNLNGIADVGEPVASLNTFTKHTFTISGTGTTLNYKIDFDQVGGSEELGVDLFELTGVLAPCPTPTLNLTGSTPVLCNGGSTGSATVSASGGAPFTYTWSPSGGNAAIATGLSAGVYTCVTTNSCGLTASRTVTITQPTAVSGFTAATMPLCNGANGSATITLSGGTLPYTYTWSSGPTSSVEPTLLAGTYTVRGTDVNGCSVTRTVTITQPSALNTSTAITNVLCFGNSTGAATVTATGGTSPYTYLWSSAQTTSVISGLNAGVRTVTVTDGNGCTRTATVNISQPGSALSTGTAITNVLCFGNSTGAATVTTSGGTGPYTYLWSSAQTTSVISSLNTGVRTVTVTDANNCISTNTITITQPGSGINTSTAVTNVLCFGASTGSATITATGGVGGYTYLWSSAQTTSVITGLNSGVRTVTVTDANGCTRTATVNISQPGSALSTSTAITNVLCFGNSTGAATVTASGGTSPYTYLWSSAQTTSVISSLNSGVRTVTVTDGSGCTATNTVNINQPASAVNSSTAVTNVLCFGNSTGAATVTASGGAGSFTYLWSSAQTTSVISSLNAGVRTVTVTDGNGCTATNTVNINQPASAVNSSTAVTNVLCFGNSTGAATVTASGGTSPYTYMWSTAATTSVITGLNAGVYTSTVTDINGCSTVNSVSIIEPSAITASVVSTFSPGCSLTNGSITINASGGAGSFTYSWSPSGGTSSTATGIGAGSYTCLITDVNSCSTTISQSLSNPSSPTITPSATNAGCAGQTNGVITLTVTGGSPAYTYSWSPAVSSNSTASSLGAGVYNATVTDANNCTVSQSFTLTAFTLPTVSANSTASVICGPPYQGTATLNASGANTYTWSTSSTGSSIAVTPSVTTSYTVTGTDANGCQNTAVITQSVDACTGISEVGVNNSEIRVYPNPNNGEFTLVVPEEGMYTIVNSIGQTIKVIEVKKDSQTISVQGLADGIYYVIGKISKAKIEVSQ